MKKIILLTCLFTSALGIINAQIKKGSIYVGGGIGFSTVKQDQSGETTTNWMYLGPVLGVAVRNNTVAGIQLLYSYSKVANNSSTVSKTNSYGGGVFLRRYMTLGKGFYLFGESNLGFRNDVNSSFIGNVTSKQNSWNIGLNLYPGISYAVTKNFHLEAGLPQLLSINYGKAKLSGVNTDQRRGFSVIANASALSNLSLGFRFFISK